MRYNILIIFIYALSRIPFLEAGFGTDGDAWRIIENGLYFSTNYEYKPSRLPGYPLYEILIYFLVYKGPLITNLVSAISGLFCIIIFKKLLEKFLRIDQRRSTLISLIFCFTPAVWVSSTITMDYLFAELFLLIAWYTLSNRKHKYISALFLGIATGVRPNNIIFIIPLMIGRFLIELKNNSSNSKIAKNIGIYVFIYFFVTILAMMPVFIKYGFLSLFSLSPEIFLNNQSIMLIGYNIIRATGVIGFLFFIAFFILIFYHNKSEINFPNFINDPNLIISLSGLLVNILLFIFSPYEPFYLIPAIPFLLYCLTSIVRNINWPSINYYMSILLLVLIFSNFIDIKIWSRDSTGKNSLVEPYIGKGILKDDYDMRKDLISESEYIFKTGNFKIPCVIITGWHFPIIRTYKKYYLEDEDCDCEIVQLLDKKSLINYIENDVTIYFTNGVENLTNQIHQYSLNDFENLNYIKY